MKILQIGTIDKAGGAAQVGWDLKAMFEAQGHDVTMFVSWKYSEDEKVFVIPRYPYQEHISRILANDLDLYRTDYILDTDAFKQADIVQVHNLHGYYFNLKTLEKMAQLKPVVWTLHDMWALTPHCAYSFDEKGTNGFFACPSLHSYPQIEWHNEWYLKWRKRSIFKRTRMQIVTPSRWLAGRVGRSILKDKPLALIPNGIAQDIFKKMPKDEARQMLSLPHDKKIVLYLASGGKSDPRKGWAYAEEVIKEFESDEKVLFLCVGGSAEDASHSNNRVHYIEHVGDKHRLAAYFSAADALLFPSLSDNFPLVILEAMSAGLPIASFDVGGVKEAVIDREHGYIAEYRNAHALADGVRFILGLSENKWDAMSESAAARAKEHYTREQMADAYLKLYKTLL